MDRIEAFAEIRAFKEDGHSRATILRFLESSGIASSTAYRWINEASHVDEAGNTPKDLAIKATLQILNKATLNENYDIALKAAATLAKLG